ncbi:MAG: CRISPR-associated endonuclease Cas1 [Candidatus Marinimicrobia bacterium]|nr:CRISPR-associated endonuclease Cas1 [Candidatus Neomarinimicrobiota bacterium]
MHLVINTYGTFLRKSGEMIEVSGKDKKQRLPVKKISSLVIGTGVHISTDIVELALKNNIDIVFLDKFGNPYGRFWHARMGSTTRIRRRQLELSLHPDGLHFALQWMTRKLDNQIAFLQEMSLKRTRLYGDIMQSINGLKAYRKEISILRGSLEEARGRIFGLEGSAGRLWWTQYSALLPKAYQFLGRSRQPAKDETNALLNYGYGVMYSLVEKAVILAGLDPFIGFIHTDNYNKVSLVFDVIEQYRIWVEEAVLSLFSKRLMKKEYFTSLVNGISLNEEGKRIFIPHLFEYLETPRRYRGREVSRKDQIQLDMYATARQILHIKINHQEKADET